MAFDDEEGPEDIPRRTPPAPDDRLWRHPSELARATAPPPGPVPTEGLARRTLGLAVAGACLTGAALACGTLWLTRPGWVREPAPTTAASRGPTTETVAYASAGLPVSDLADAVAPHLVRVEARVDGSWVSGSGIWLDATRVLVAAPLVEGAAFLAVTDEDQRRLDARLASTDPATGAAVLEVEARGDRSAPLLAASARSGQAVAVIGGRGSSTELEQQRVVPTTVSSTGVRSTIGGEVIHDALQLDRALPDDALGAVVIDANGHLVGVVVSVEDEDGLAVAVPARDVLSAGHQLAESGEVHRAWLGVQAVDLDMATAELLGIDGGAVITSVQDGSPAAEAGLAKGDAITSIAGKDVLDASDLVVAIHQGRPGDEVEVQWWRDGAERTSEVALGG